MRFIPTVYLASGALAAAVGRSSEPDCILLNRREMAADSACGNIDILKTCFDKFTGVYVEDLTACYKEAGCDDETALKMAEGAGQRCEQLFDGPELRRRTRGELDARAPEATMEAFLARADGFANANEAHLFPRTAIRGGDCVSTKTTSTKTCKETTIDGKATSTDCSSTAVPTEVCKEGLTCSRDGQGQNVCMKLQDNLDVAGVIVAIVMSVGAVAGIITITYLCVQNKKEQKRLTAKAEATALARAATKKKRAAEQRAPLMAQAGASAPGGGDPFADRNRS